MQDVILHAFDWHYEDITESARKIAALGYGAILIAPPLYSDEQGPEWWQRYQPKDYRVVRSYLGDKKRLEQAIQALHASNVRVYADVVFNHMANEKSARNDPYDFPGDRELARYLSEAASFERDRLYGDLGVGLFSQRDFNPQGDIRNWNDLHESQEFWLSGLPDLDLNDRVVEQQKACLSALNHLGFDGYRIDAIKHLPYDHIARVFQTEILNGKFVFGEALTSNDHEENLFLWPLLDMTTISFYDFPLHETLRRTFSPTGSMRELVNPAANRQALQWHRAVTFSITHDIPNNDGFRWQMLDPQDEFLANVYIMGRDGGIPLVFSDHNQSAARYSSDENRWNDAWSRQDTAGMIAFHNAVHGTPQRPLFEHDGFIVFARGDRGIVAINKTAEWQHPRIWTDGLKQGRYHCMMHGYDMRISGDWFDFDIPPRQAQMWLWN